MPVPPLLNFRKLAPLAGLCLLALLVCAPASAVTPSAKVHKTHHRALNPSSHWNASQYSRMYPGSHDLLVRQNEELNRLQLPRIADEGELIRYEVSGVLV